jgi:hypothetical protein
MIAFGAVERAKFESFRPRRDAGKSHANLAFWAAESLNCEQWDCGWVIGHCIPPLSQAGAQHSLSPMVAYGGPVMEPACASEFRSRWSILLTFTDLDGGGAKAAFQRLPRFRSISRNHDERSPTGAPKQRGRKRRLVRLACLLGGRRSIRSSPVWATLASLPRALRLRDN